MTRWIVLIALLLGGILLTAGPAAADDLQPAPVTIWRYNNHPEALPFVRSEKLAVGMGVGGLLE